MPLGLAAPPAVQVSLWSNDCCVTTRSILGVPILDNHYRKGINMDTSILDIRAILIDCGAVHRKTRGVLVGFFSENIFPPFDRRL
jgi:hypothetical protein